MKVDGKGVFALIVAAGVAFSASAALAQDKAATPATAPTKQVEKKDEKADKKMEKSASASGPKVGDAAPAFTVTDTDGKTHNLSDYKGKTVVLQWFNPECPFVVMHYKDTKTFNDLYTEFNPKGVVFIAINSSAPGKQGAGKDVNAKAKADWKIAYPIGLDESGTVGMAYGSKNTPTMYIIGADGKLAYRGAIDNAKGTTVGDKNYVRQALNQILKGETVTEAETKPYGCSVKYAKGT